ncbi:hypothetical protein [Psychroserpens burtonensis]|uniref:hypothetical protein n=1 Tax=Psychroserpens burtonensis TaxID=49278 RepID=UPI00042182FC|nr:hypothetical protein [Psychroserpens burtonensis]
MILTDQHIKFIENNLNLYGVKSKDLREDLLDHICTYIETSNSQDFDGSYQETLQKFGGYTSFQNLQLETNLQKFALHAIRLKRVLHLASTIAVLLIMTGLLFKVMHWPYATILLFSGCIVFILVVIPTYFYDRYKSSIHKFS